MDAEIRAIQLKLGIKPIRATLGDANGRLYDGDKYFVRWPASAGGSGLSFPSSVRLRPGVSMREKPGVGVRIGIGDDGEYEIIGADYKSIVNSGDHPIRENPLSPYGNPQQVGVNQSDILTLQAHQTSVAGMTVYVKPFIYFVGNTVFIWQGGVTSSLSGSVPGSINQHRLVMIYLNTSQALATATSTAKDQGNPLTISDDVQECWTSVYSNHPNNIPIWCYRLYYGQTEIKDSDRFLDCRGFINTTNALKSANQTYTRTYTTTSRTLNAYTPDAESAAYTGIDNAQPGTVYMTVADGNALRVAVENQRAMTENLLQVMSAYILDGQTSGVVK